jgi:hypothetical protein
VKATIFELMNEYEDQHLQNVESSKASCSCVKSSTNGGRVEIGLELHIIDWLDQTTTRIAEVSPN